MLIRLHKKTYKELLGNATVVATSVALIYAKHKIWGKLAGGNQGAIAINNFTTLSLWADLMTALQETLVSYYIP